MVERPAAGLHYPAATGDFLAWFSSDADCLDYLEWLRWPAGFLCPECGRGGWRLSDGRFECSGCGRRTSVTAGTIFDRTRTPLTVWFTACWQFAAAKDGISALSLQRSLEIGSYQTAWAMLHRLRSVLVRPGRERLTGVVEVDETYMGGEEPGLRGGRAKGKKLLVGIAVERHQPRGLGRCRMAVLPDAKTDTPRAFLADHVEEGATVITDGWQPYRAATAGRYVHQRQPGAGREANTTLPGVHRVASLAKRWLLDPPQVSADHAPLPIPLDEFVFRFNRRRSRRRGLVFYRVLDLAVAHQPLRYRDLVLNPAPPRAHRRHPAPAASHRPWTARRRDGHGEGLTSPAPVKWIPQKIVKRGRNHGVSMAVLDDLDAGTSHTRPVQPGHRNAEPLVRGGRHGPGPGRHDRMGTPQA